MNLHRPLAAFSWCLVSAGAILVWGVGIGCLVSGTMIGLLALFLWMDS